MAPDSPLPITASKTFSIPDGERKPNSPTM
jgi:hypothetical protein